MRMLLHAIKFFRMCYDGYLHVDRPISPHLRFVSKFIASGNYAHHAHVFSLTNALVLGFIHYFLFFQPKLRDYIHLKSVSSYYLPRRLPFASFVRQVFFLIFVVIFIMDALQGPLLNRHLSFGWITSSRS